jgi:uncharacterized membrane protein YraQ (UPF0718 family)
MKEEVTMTHREKIPLRKGRVHRWGFGVFLFIAVVGLFFVKWSPYYRKALIVTTRHSLGESIISGEAATPPEPSWQAAWGYALSYGKAVWPAMVLGLVLGSAVHALVPKDWIGGVFGKGRFKNVALAGLASIPSMM